MGSFKGMAASLMRAPDTEFGQTFYVLDGDYRTIAQGWSKADGTGPLDMFAARNPGYVFSAAGPNSAANTTDAAAIQAAIDAAVDYRGDTVYLTPGSFSLATSLAINCFDLRIMGPPVTSPVRARVTVTDAVGDHAISVDRVEVCNLRFVPLTAQNIFQCAAGADYLHFHDYLYDAIGIAASTSTIFATLAGASNDYCTFERFSQYTDAAQGPHLSVGGAANDLLIQDFVLSHGGGATLAIALLNITAAIADGGVCIRRGKGITRGAASTAVTNLVKLTDSGADIMTFSVENFTGSVGFCAANGLVALNGAETAEIGLYSNYLMTVSGGTGLGTVYTA